jgi:hypothetical protein
MHSNAAAFDATSAAAKLGTVVLLVLLALVVVLVLVLAVLLVVVLLQPLPKALGTEWLVFVCFSRLLASLQVTLRLFGVLRFCGALTSFSVPAAKPALAVATAGSQGAKLKY